MAVDTILWTIIIFINYAQYQAEDCALHLATEEDAWDKVIRRKMQEDYESYVSPNNNTCVAISTYFQLKSFSLDEYESKFTAKVWSRLKWHDERLTWSPDENGGVDKIIMSGQEIWMPTIKLLNSIETDVAYSHPYYGDCLVSHDGEILCVPELVYESYCNAKLKNWPYDVQNCTLVFGTSELLYGVAKLNVSQSGKGMSTLAAEFGTGWNIMKIYTKINESNVEQLSITLTVERQAYGLVVILIFPSIIIALLTLTSTFLNVIDSVRLGFLCFSLVCHFIFLRAIQIFIPLHTGDTPVILLFIRGSVLITVSSILMTYLLSTIIKNKMAPHLWITLISDKLFNGPGRDLIFPIWKLEKTGEGGINDEIWMNFANILNNVFMLAVAIAYVVLFSVFMPEQPLLEY